MGKRFKFNVVQKICTFVPVFLAFYRNAASLYYLNDYLLLSCIMSFSIFEAPFIKTIHKGIRPMIIYELFLKTDYSWNEQEDSLLQFVSDERKHVISSYRFIPDRLRSLYGALLVKMGIYCYCGIPPQMQRFSHEFMRKPQLLNKEAAAAFNLSHSGRCVVCGVSGCHLGIDTEEIILPYPKEILSCFSPAERAECECGNDEEQADAFYKLWTRKEAYGKWNGFGLCQNLAAVDIHKKGYRTWKENAHIISIYSESNEETEIRRLSTEEVTDFYRNITL